MIKLDAKKLRADLGALRRASGELRTELAGEEVMVGLAEQAATIVASRTGRGVDADGEAFAAYSESYAERRRKKGRGIRPDLTYTGRMLGNMTGKFLFYRKSAVVFSRSEEANKAAGNSKRRDFFDVRLPAELEALARALGLMVDAAVKRVGLGGSA